MEGIEPTRPCGHQILSLARLPIPPHRRTMNIYEEDYGSASSGWQVSIQIGFGLAVGNGFNFGLSAFVRIA